MARADSGASAPLVPRDELSPASQEESESARADPGPSAPLTDGWDACLLSVPLGGPAARQAIPPIPRPARFAVFAPA
jgi:hypothetical protein